MQGGSLAAATSSPPSFSSRHLAIGSSAPVDRQRSCDLDRSMVSISGSFSQALCPSACQVALKHPNNAPWTPAPPRSPRQRTVSPMRFSNGQHDAQRVPNGPNGQAARVLSREMVEEYLDVDRSSRASARAPRVPFLSMPSSQHPRQTPKRSLSPCPRASSLVMRQDTEERTESKDRLLMSSFRNALTAASSPPSCSASSPTMQRPPVPRHQSSALPTSSPRQRPLSPLGLRGPQTTPPTVLRHPGRDFDDVSSHSSRAFPNPVLRLSEEPSSLTSRMMPTPSLLESSFEAPHASIGTLASKTLLPRRSRLSRTPSEIARARTLSPARQCPNVPQPLCKDVDDASSLSRSFFASASPSADRDSAPKLQSRSFVAPPALDGLDFSTSVLFGGAPLVTLKDEASRKTRETSPAALSSSAVLPMRDHREVKKERLRKVEDQHSSVQKEQPRQALRHPRATPPTVMTTPTLAAPLGAAPATPTTPATAQQKDVEVLEPVESGRIPSAEELKPWLEAAANFKMSLDFEVEATAGCDFGTLMTTMKRESAGKWTIQAMADKLLLNGLLENLGLPHMPMIFANRSLGKLRERLEVLVDKLIVATAKKQPYDIIVKPTHLSSAQGVLSFDKVHAPHREDTIRQLETHMRKYLETQANKQESLALQSLKPGFIGQPKYKSVVAFKAPLELKVCALWGKARSAVWWWGCRASGPAQVPHRNVWLVRAPSVPGELSDNDGWEVIHNHPGGNLGWENAVKLFKRHMPEMAALTETLATALGTPFVRADFFVGSPKWGVRLNEVAYGCGLEYRNLVKENGTQRVVDDKPAMAEILRQGMELCTSRIPAHHFLQMLGVQGNEYADSAVVPLTRPLTTPCPQSSSASDQELAELAVEENLCKSMKELPPREEEPSKEVPAKVLDQVHRIRPNVVKPPQSHIPTLMMPRVATVISANPSVFLGPVPASSLKLHAPDSHKARTNACGIALAQPRAAPVMLRASVAR